jgi:hypothetical protein
MLTGRENIQLPPPVRQRQEKTPEPEKPDELHNNPLFIILIPILMIGIVATIASATRPKRRKVKIAVIMGLAAGVAVMLLMLVDAPPGKAVSCSEMEQTVVIALDISRSMGDPLLGSNETKFAAGKRAVSDLIRGFGNDTKYSIIDFHMGKADIYYTDKTAPPNRVYGPTAVRTVEEAEAFIGNPNNKYLFEKADEETVISKNLPLSYGWSTSIQPALLAGMAILKHSDSPIKRIIVLTDGQETLNITELAANYALPIEIDAVMLLSEDYDSEYFDPPTPEDVVEWTAGEIYEASDYANVLESLRKAATVCR